jgi:hypothetical protein
MTTESILIPSTTPTTRQVWPPTADSLRGRWEYGSPVVLDEVRVGDGLVLWVVVHGRRVVVEGTVSGVGLVAGRRWTVDMATARGTHVLTRQGWAERMPRAPRRTV